MWIVFKKKYTVKIQNYIFKKYTTLISEIYPLIIIMHNTLKQGITYILIY